MGEDGARASGRVRLPRVTASIVALLVGLDVARAYSFPELRPLQWLVCLLGLVRLRGELLKRGRGTREVLPLLALAACLVPTYVDRSRAIESDGIHYYAYLRSLLFDRDLDLRNDYRLLEYNEHHLNVLPIGAPLLWSPFVVPVYAVMQAARLFGGPAPNGIEPAFRGAVSLANFAYVAAGLFVLMGTLRRFVSPAAAFWTTLLAWVGSPLRFYLSVLPSMAHGTEFFAAALVLRASLQLRQAGSRTAALAAGAACGLVFLVRSQDGLLLGLPILLLTPGLLTRARQVPTLRLLALLGAAFVVVALPQIAVWQAMYGVPLLVPHKLLHGEAFMRLDQPRFFATLFAPEGGLLTNYPTLLVALVGLVCVAPSDPLYVGAVAVVFVAGWYVNATVFDWYQVRRFTGIVPLLAPGLAQLVAPLTRAGLLPVALVAFLALRYDLALHALRDAPGRPAPVRRILGELDDGLARDVYGLIEPRAPRAAVALLAAYTGEPLLDGPMTRVELGKDTSLLRLPRPARYLSEVSAEGGVACRWVQGEPDATIFLPLAWDGEVTFTLTAAPLQTEPPITMSVWLNDVVLGSRPLGEGFADYRFGAPPGTARLGTNVLTVRFDRTPVYHRVRGTGPRQVRPAALAAIMLNRGEPRP
jgi:hypothetical protein